MSLEIIGQSIPNMPWQDRPEGCKDVVWRYNANPIIPRDLLPTSNSIFNSAVVPFESDKGHFAGVFRVDDKERNMAIHAGFSEDGIHWNINPEKVEWINDDPDTAEANPWQYGYDPRCVWIEDRFWITWCNAYGWKPTIGVGWTKDFKEFHQMENAYLPFNRNGVLFPRKINGEYVMFSRPSDSGHTPFGDMYLSHSKDMTYWGKHRHVMLLTEAGSPRRSAQVLSRSKQAKAGWYSTTAFSRAATASFTASAPAFSTRISPGRLSIAAASTSSIRARSTKLLAMYRTLHSPAQHSATRTPAESLSTTAALIPA